MTSSSFLVGLLDYVGDMSLLIVSGPSNAGPGEREQMVDAANSRFAGLGMTPEQIVRIDVPGRGAGEEGDGSLRGELDAMVPLLQSGSLFGDAQGLLMVDAQNLQKAEREMFVELYKSADPGAVEVVMVFGGAVPKPIKDLGPETVAIKKIWERDVTKWLAEEVKARGIRLDRGASEALVKRFGTDTASLSRALDQLEGSSARITGELVMERFKNRPDEGTWQVVDAIGKGDVATSLRKLSDFLVHGHPLVYLAALESDLKKRALAASAPDQPTLREWVGGSDRQVGRLWNQRGKVRDSSLRLAQEALVRADRTIKTQPEEIHRVTLERLTVAFCRWYG